MSIHNINQLKHKTAYGIQCASITDNSAFNIVSCVIEPRGETTPHAHHELEVFIILSGSGIITLDQNTQKINAGDYITILPNQLHQLINTSADQALRFLSIYGELDQNKQPFKPNTKKLLNIISAPPTPNGPLHLGHISGPYLAADILARAHKQAMHISGTDDHQNYVKNKLILFRNTKQIKQDLDNFNIQPQQFISPYGNKSYQVKIQKIFQELVNNKKIIQKNIEVMICRQCEIELHDSYIQGNCHHCNSNITGNTCESCFNYSDSTQLKNSQCTQCNNTAERKTKSSYIFDLEPYRKLLIKHNANINHPEFIKKYLTHILNSDQILPSIKISHHDHWGLSINDLEQPEQKVFNPWFEMAANYIVENIQNREFVFCFGADNSFYYTLFIPAIFIAYAQTQDQDIDQNTNSYDYLLPSAYISNQFYLLDSKKFSTSRNHAVWASDIVEKYSTDSLRAYLCYTRSESHQTNFSLENFELFDQFFIKQKVSLLLKVKINIYTQENLVLKNYFTQLEKYYAIENFSPRKIIRVLFDLIDEILGLNSISISDLNYLIKYLSPIMPLIAKSLENLVEDNIEETLGEKYA